MKCFVVMLAFFAVAIPAVAADVSGNWKGSVSTANGDLPIAFTLKADGEKLTGTMSGPDGAPVAIEEGKIDGNNISFSVTLAFNGNSFSLSYKGVVSDDQIAFTSSFNGNNFTFTVKRAQ